MPLRVEEEELRVERGRSNRARREGPPVREADAVHVRVAGAEIATRDRRDGLVAEVLRGRADIAGIALFGRGESPRRKREQNCGYRS
jgi:hypothetical protein